MGVYFILSNKERHSKSEKVVIMKNEIVLKSTYWASVSGGKDSLFMLNYILHNLNRYPLNGVVHFELELDFPFIKEVIDYMEEECKKFGIPFYRIKPRYTFMELYERYGFPTRKARWCNSKYKLDCKIQLVEMLKEQNCKPISYIGYCVDEVSRYKKRGINIDEIYPLVENEIEEDVVLEWAKNQPIFKDYYKYNRRCGCMLCPMQSMYATAYLMKYYPKQYEKMMELAKETEVKREREIGRPFSVWSSNPKYNSEYRDKRVRDVYLPKLDYRLNYCDNCGQKLD